jgi:hypothetical protein
MKLFNRKKVKKTIAVKPENSIFITMLMNDMGFVEVDRVVTHDGVMYLTFEGDKSKYHENGYIKVSNTADFSSNWYYYSINTPDGFYVSFSEEEKYHQRFIEKIQHNEYYQGYLLEHEIKYINESN